MRHFVILAAMLMVCLPASVPAQYPWLVNAGPYNGPAVTFKGTVKVITKKEVILNLDLPETAGPDAEHQTLTFRLSHKTKFQKGDQPIKLADIATGAHVAVDATRDGDQKFSALGIAVTVPK